MFAPDYPIVGARLLLRPLDAERDSAAVYAYQSRPDVCRYIPYEPRTLDEVRAKLTDTGVSRSTLEREGQVLHLAVVVRETEELVGDVILAWRSEAHRSGELGYVLHPAAQGHGYATEAVGLLLGLAFDGLGLHRVTARIDARNTASAAVLRRAGFRQEAVLLENEWFKGEWTDEIDFAIL
ncbi:GNAT family N-acetyltransferase [Jatrophihabitans endophyticus]|uniref:GNAT family N-acetyltransferase n=1 Tax=Jatrophihabitans endophyticus TaxID=1206085 RepID=UPI0019F61C78|nr:GNAT family N-acetyltransferase [Jatrophihabitans endophyticus]MBE7189769.1 GNAT family N-acetyltransferase [Jatrophihabitans endophyticus]